METAHRQAFAARLHQVCDDKGLPKVGKGRYVKLAEEFKVSYQEAKKWLDGKGYPNIDMAVRIADWGGVNVNWLLQGTLPKRGERVDPDAMAVADAIAGLPTAQRNAALQFLRYQIHDTKDWFAREPLMRYDQAIEHLVNATPAAAPAAASEATHEKQRLAS